VPVESTAKSAAPIEPSVTITGCLQREDEEFWLTNTSGTDAPKSRSWRSGFLRKRQPRIQLVDTTNTLRLRDHVGRRVSATGVLDDREMRARYVGRVADKCS
jgi:hypothetical protein